MTHRVRPATTIEGTGRRLAFAGGGGPESKIPANRDPIATHNLIATDDPENIEALKDIAGSLL